MSSNRVKEKLLRSIEFSREKLNGYVNRKELNSDEVIELSRKLDGLINSYYHASAQVEVMDEKAKAKNKRKTKARAKIKRETPQLNNEPMQKHIPIPKLQHIPYETPYPRIVKIGEKEYTLIKLF
ncbi:aspartyl-phosphate phosphatase Spo0E family protein [Desulfosporosinus sp. OT]|uniref:aspartyl-phosphate phosphatase Spo0E family protein n=1 Tax=Desulfosporosinus sp. OT TaxID=913865 RepID=UPI000223A515|nr:aspartyl-phosphate phosphatase Spo0E family protein [Desulfosporosinus sp. OT]EGW36445.1 spo0E like sporulation regulatory family protein [Desulfosporosinus sp. OT]